MHIVAVYGSLRRGFGNHRLLEGSTYLGEAMSPAEYTMLHLGGFPGIVRGGETAIKVELYEVDDDTLYRLDRLESHPSWYCRQDETFTLADGTQVEAGVYVLPSSYNEGGRFAMVTSGDWSNK
jgi:gamma-glutamylaminecyclotransferase